MKKNSCYSTENRDILCQKNFRIWCLNWRAVTVSWCRRSFEYRICDIVKHILRIQWCVSADILSISTHEWGIGTGWVLFGYYGLLGGFTV